MKTEELKEKLNSLITTVDSETQYWFFRTMSGSYFEDYFQNGYIAFGYDKISSKQINDLPEEENAARTLLKQYIKAIYFDLTENRVALAAGQLLRFYREIKVGDVIVIPSFESSEYAIGIVESGIYVYDDIVRDAGCPFLKRRKVRWIERLGRYKFDPILLLKFANQQTISLIDNDYVGFIERKLKRLYTKDDKSYLVLRVTQDKGLSWNDFYFISDFGEIFKAISDELGLEIDLSEIEMKVNVQSPGDILMSVGAGNGYALALAWIIASFLIIGIVGGDVEAWKIKMKTKGLGYLVERMVKLYLKTKKEKLERRSIELSIQEKELELKERAQKLQLERFNDPCEVGNVQ
ncbi:hypothetical protein [Prevotella intermedia]|uniref:Uncharacterized protein n=1 Tax=Prevotella intermedia TaxID=28131 RepID=A0A2D3LII3_PREIN|nr:hypothetical protein [Prevotella intermedia]ATV30425.1 hypothetical protein CTM46_02500 [Prevotella intermedia]PJI23325.1 hypothetical protein CTM45_08570 [Prevotella intermedia]